jgi:hypothetical protein
MRKLTEQKSACNCNLDDDHAAALLQFLEGRGYALILDQCGYREMAFRGWSRGELKRAATILKSTGKIIVDVSSYGGTLRLELVEEGGACVA